MSKKIEEYVVNYLSKYNIKSSNNPDIYKKVEQYIQQTNSSKYDLEVYDLLSSKWPEIETWKNKKHEKKMVIQKEYITSTKCPKCRAYTLFFLSEDQTRSGDEGTRKTYQCDVCDTKVISY